MRTTKAVNGVVTTTTTYRPVTILNEQAIRRVLIAMGPERVKRGMRAFDNYPDNQYCSTRCFLGRGVSRGWERLWDRWVYAGDAMTRWAKRLDVSERDIRCVTAAFDTDHTNFRRYTEQWLNA